MQTIMTMQGWMQIEVKQCEMAFVKSKSKKSVYNSVFWTCVLNLSDGKLVAEDHNLWKNGGGDTSEMEILIYIL